MRSRQLESALTAFVEEAALALGERTAAGEEVPFEIVAQSSRAHRTPLYCYRPLTGEFIRERSAPLAALPSHARALAAIAELDGLGRYLLSRGAAHAPTEPRERARTALRQFLEDVFDGHSDFELRPEQLRAALDRLQEAVRPDGDPVVVVGTLHGLTLSAPELALARGLTLAAPDAIDGAPAEALAPDATGAPHLLAVLTAEGDDPRTAAADGVAALRDLVRALRLFGDGRIALGSLGWSRVGAGPWRPLALGTGGRPRGMLVVTAEQEDELRAFCSLVARRAPQDDEVAWALERFNLGCERENDHTALSDYLLALRALLEPDGAAGGMLAGRLAAICAVPEDRQALAERVLRALELERTIIRGDAPQSAGGDALVQAIAGHLRALLRDLICGHLGRDLVTLADELLLGPEPAPDPEPALGPRPEAADAADADATPRTGRAADRRRADAARTPRMPRTAEPRRARRSGRRRAAAGPGPPGAAQGRPAQTRPPHPCARRAVRRSRRGGARARARAVRPPGRAPARGHQGTLPF